MSARTYAVEFSKFAAKQIEKLPGPIRTAIDIWKESIERLGLGETRKLKGYHDEPLKGHRRGQRSVRLNRSYRLIYEVIDQKEVTILGVKEVNKHDYR